MKTILYEGMTEQEIINHLELDNCGVEEHFNFVRQFEEVELEDFEKRHIEASKQLYILDQELKKLSEPLQEQIKGVKKSLNKLISIINQGGEEVTEKVYCFPDYDASVIGLYDQKGRLVGTRPMSRKERQFHINSFKNVANGGFTVTATDPKTGATGTQTYK